MGSRRVTSPAEVNGRAGDIGVAAPSSLVSVERRRPGPIRGRAWQTDDQLQPLVLPQPSQT